MNNFSSILPDVYVQLNMFRASSRPSSGAQQLQQQPLVLPLERGGSSAPKVKPEAATAVELLMMGVRTPETCWAVHKCQVINLRNCSSSWLIYLNYKNPYFKIHKYKMSLFRNAVIIWLDGNEPLSMYTIQLHKFINVWNSSACWDDGSKMYVLSTGRIVSGRRATWPCLYASVPDTMALTLLYLNLFQSDFFEEVQTHVVGLCFTAEMKLTHIIIIIIIIIIIFRL
jgi:hypothetical protein